MVLYQPIKHLIMKNYFLLLLTFISFSGFSQVSFGARHVGKPSDLKPKALEEFKASTTIFVLSDVIDADEYAKILEETWTVTPYKIVPQSEYDLQEYYNKNYSIAELVGFKRSKTTKMGSVVHSLHTYINIGLYDAETIDKKLSKVKAKKEKKREEKINEIFRNNKKPIAKIYLFPTSDFVNTALSEEKEVIVEEMYTENVFFNYSTGFLKNYFQQTNDLIDTGETYWMYEKDHDSKKIAGLTTSKLYVPNYITQRTNAFTAEISDGENKDVEKLFSKYDYDYEFISTEDLDKAIEENKEFYYLRYARANAERFLQVVNSKTGEVVYREYITGLSYNLKAKNLGELSDVIAKSAKKLAK